ncbi:MAG TPA: PEGA domain-containing protein [Kofleriaceae bacterium]|nr:PEGA domain-containing protein [Kofleriaceae bacterium]
MTDHTDDDALGFDLDAWQAPPAPAGLADAVVARMKEPVGKPAIDVGERPSRRRGIWIAGGVLATAGAIAAVVGSGVLDDAAPSPGSGSIATAKPSHLDLGASSAELDANTELAWRRDGHRILVTQTRGVVTWKVGGDDTITIEAGPAAIEGSNTSLRTEVEMNLTDARVIGASAATAAAVAMATVVVYEGHIKVSSAGQTVNVAPGSTALVRAGEPPVEPPIVGDRTQELEAKIRTLTAENGALREQLEQADIDHKLVAPAGTGMFDRATIDEALRPLQLATCSDGSYDGTLAIVLAVEADGSVSEAKVIPADAQPASCVKSRVKSAKFPRRTNKRMVTHSITYVRAKTLCDADELRRKADALLGNAEYQAALTGYESSLACKLDSNTVLKAYMAACKAHNVSKARHFFSRVALPSQSYMSQVCIKEGIDPRGGSPTADDAKPDLGNLVVNSEPAANVEIDGKPVGRAPLRINLVPGKHRVTFELAGDRYTFNVVIKANEVTHLEKTLQ